MSVTICWWCHSLGGVTQNMGQVHSHNGALRSTEMISFSLGNVCVTWSKSSAKALTKGNSLGYHPPINNHDNNAMSGKFKKLIGTWGERIESKTFLDFLCNGCNDHLIHVAQMSVTLLSIKLCWAITLFKGNKKKIACVCHMSYIISASTPRSSCDCTIKALVIHISESITARRLKLHQSKVKIRVPNTGRWAHINVKLLH